MEPLVQFLPSPLPSEADEPLQWTASPVRLLISDIALFFRLLPVLPNVLRPTFTYKSGALDELYPSWPNIKAVSVHVFLIFYQLAFFASLVPLFIFFPVWTAALIVGLALLINQAICNILLNGPRTLTSKVHVSHNATYGSEYWAFVNGVSVGHHWLQTNIDRLALTFGREVTGVHNPTSGIIFDIIQCLIERNFSYATQDVRDSYALVKSALLNPKHKKVIFILHSQGGIEGSLVLDWLLAELPREVLRKLEVYTFGNAANHFNNPRWSMMEEEHAKVIPHIEHYANSRDFVARWGVSEFIRLPNRYMGRLFERRGTGHLLVQHHLDYMFPLNKEGTACANENAFMDSEIEVSLSDNVGHANGHGHGGAADEREEGWEEEKKRKVRREIKEYEYERAASAATAAALIDVNSPTSPMSYSPVSYSPSSPSSKSKNGFSAPPSPSSSSGRATKRKPRVKQFSRLWGYRNGMLPFDAPAIELAQDISSEKAVASMKMKAKSKASSGSNGHVRNRFGSL